MSFWGELRRRNVVKVGVAYLVVTWLLVQVVDVVLPMFNAPEWVAQTLTFVLILGLPIVLIIAWAFEITPEGVKKTASVPLEESITSVTSQRLNYVITALVVLVLAFVVFDQYVFQDRAPADVSRQASESTLDSGSDSPARVALESQQQALPNSVAVLPFHNLSPDPDNAYFAAGIHDEILNQLAKLRNLNVIARTSVMQYANAARPITEIARELNVETVMEGSVSYADGRVAVRAQLIDANTGVHIWSESYNREFADIFGIQADIAMNIANALEAEFSDEERARIERPPTDSSAAYAIYLQASTLGTGQASTIHELLDRAIALDDEFSLAYASKASIYSGQLINSAVGSTLGWAELEPRVRENARKALELDPKSGLALNALGDLASYSWRWSAAQESYDQALEGGFALGSGSAYWFRSWSGERAEALRIAQQMVAVNPRDWFAHFVYGIVLHYARDYDAAAAAFRDGIALAAASPLPHLWLAFTETARGDPEEAKRELELTEQLLGENRVMIVLVGLVYGYGRVGDLDNARRVFDEITAIADRGEDIGAGGWASAHLAVGHLDEALEWLQRGVEKATRHEPDTGYYSLMNIRMNATNDPVLERPEFVDVRDRLRGD